MSKIQTLILHSWQNAQQIYKYFFNYALENKRSFHIDKMDRIKTEFSVLTHRVKTIYNEAAFKSFLGDLNINLRGILSMCRNIWIKFDATQMSQGLLVTFLPIFLSFILINNTRSIDSYTIFQPREVGYTYLLNCAAGYFGYRNYRNFTFKTEGHAIIFSTSMMSTLILVFHTVQNWTTIANNWSKIKSFNNLPSRIILIILVCVFFSNSFIIQEGKILSHLLVATILLMVYEILQNIVRIDFKNKFKIQQLLTSIALKVFAASLLAVTLIHYATSLFRCREDQGNCTEFINNNKSDGFSQSKTSNVKTYILSVVVIFLYTTLSRMYLRFCGNLTGNGINVLIARYGPTVASICAGGHIFLLNGAINDIQRTYVDFMALIIYALFLIQIIVFIISPLMVYIVSPKNTSTVTLNYTENVTPEIFKKMKRMYEREAKGPRNKIPVVYGLATLYSSILISFGTFLAMVLIILSNPESSTGIVICVAVGAIILLLHGIIRYRTAKSFGMLLYCKFVTLCFGYSILSNFF